MPPNTCVSDAEPSANGQQKAGAVASSICFMCKQPIVGATENQILHPRPHRQRYVSGCRCCSCRRMREWRHRRDQNDPDSMTLAELRTFSQAAQKLGPQWDLAFRVSVNAMLWLSEIVQLKRGDLVEGEPCKIMVRGVHNDPRSHASRLVAKVPVDLDCHTVHALNDWTDSHSYQHGRVFGFTLDTLKDRYAEAIRISGLYEYDPRALRNTGIRLRMLAAKSVEQFDYVRRCARIRTLESFLPYLPKMPPGEKPHAMLRQVSWYPR